MIKIEVTGNSTAEVADKLLAIGTSLKHGASVWWTHTDAPEKLRQTLRAELDAEMDPIMPEVAEMAAAPEPHTSATSAPTPDTSSSSASKPTEQPAQAKTAEAAGTPSAPAEPVAKTENTPAAPSEPKITADTVRDLVLTVVREKGRDAMVAVLDTFGAARASDVPQEQVPELVAALEALL